MKAKDGSTPTLFELLQYLVFVMAFLVAVLLVTVVVVDEAGIIELQQEPSVKLQGFNPAAPTQNVQLEDENLPPLG